MFHFAINFDPEMDMFAKVVSVEQWLWKALLRQSVFLHSVSGWENRLIYRLPRIRSSLKPVIFLNCCLCVHVHLTDVTSVQDITIELFQHLLYSSPNVCVFHEMLKQTQLQIVLLAVCLQLNVLELITCCCLIIRQEMWWKKSDDGVEMSGLHWLIAVELLDIMLHGKI